MELNSIFYEEDYSKAFDFLNEINRTLAQRFVITEIEPDISGKRRYRFEPAPQLTQKQLAEIEIDSLRNWFNGYYSEHEQKYRRLYTLKLYCDDGTHPYDKLTELYQTAEKNRKRIQELESQYGIE